MASTTANRVLYRSPDALQNLRVKVSLTRVSGPRADRAVELEAKLARERGEAQQRADESERHAATMGTIFKEDAPESPERQSPDDRASDRAAAQQAAAAAATALAPYPQPAPIPAPYVPPAASDEIVDGGDDVGAAPAATSYAPQVSSRRARSSLVRGDASAAPAPSTSTFDPYGAPPTAPAVPSTAGPVTESAAAAPALRPPVPESEFPHFERVVAWQEKIFSRAEATARARSSGSETELDRKYDAMVRDGNLTGETIYTYVAADRFADDRDAEKTVTTSATERVNGLFRAVFGSPAARVVAANARGRDATAKRTELARGRRRRGGALPVTFVICADCGPLELPPDHPAMAGGDDELTRRREGEEILMTIEAFPDGSVAISPDFCQESDGEPYRVERRDGSVWEYGVTNASTRDETPLEKRQKDIAPTAAMRAMQLARRRRAGPGAFVPPPEDAAERLVFLGEIVSGRGFEHDRLYCEWALEYDKELWFVESPAGGNQTSAPEPVVAGATQISKTAVYPSDALSGDETLSGSGDGFFSSERLVAHWSAPIELCLVARRAPAPREYPVIFFQVSSYDAWDRYRPEGYGALSLRPHDQTGARAREVRTWRAGGTIRDRIATHYVGGAPEIGNLSYVAAPAFGAERDAGSQKVHSRLGFVADASGTIAVRAHTMTQRPKALSAGARKGISALRGVLTKGKGLGFGGPGARDQTSLGGGEALDVDDDAENAAPGNGSARGDSDQTEDVVARARARIAEARAQGRLDPDVSARATLIARGAGAPQAQAPVPAPAPRASSTSTSSRAETAGSTPSATTPPSNDA